MTAAPLTDELVPDELLVDGPMARVVPWCARPSPVDVAFRTVTADVSRVLVVGGGGESRRPGRVPWALTQLWRREGRPLLVAHGLGRGAARWACRWAGQHDVHGIRCALARPSASFDVLLAFGPTSAAMTTALQLARRAGVDVMDGGRVGEFR